MSEIIPAAPLLSSPDDRRINARKRVEGLSLVDLGTENGGLILDLSEGGLAMQAVLPVLPRPAVPVHFELPNTRVCIDATAEIAWVTTSKKAGLRFTDLPADAREQIRQWLNTESSFRDALAEPIADSTVIYNDLPAASSFSWEWPGAEKQRAAAERTIRYIPDFAKKDYLVENLGLELENLPTVFPIEDQERNEQTPASEKTMRHAPEFAKKEFLLPNRMPRPVEPFAGALPEELEAADLPQVQPVAETITGHDSAVPLMTVQKSVSQRQDLSVVAGRPMASQMAEAVAAVWESTGALEHMHTLAPAARRRIVYEQEFQARALSLWLWEMGSGPAPLGASARIVKQEGSQSQQIALGKSSLKEEPRQVITSPSPERRQTGTAVLTALAQARSDEKSHRSPILKAAPPQDGGQKRVRIAPADPNK